MNINEGIKGTGEELEREIDGSEAMPKLMSCNVLQVH